MPEKTEEEFFDDDTGRRWFKTGDIGQVLYLLNNASIILFRSSFFFTTSALTGGGGWQVEDYRQKEGLGETTVWRVSYNLKSVF